MVSIVHILSKVGRKEIKAKPKTLSLYANMANIVYTIAATVTVVRHSYRLQTKNLLNIHVDTRILISKH